MKLNNVSIVLTGASGGIGAATASELAKAGAHLILVGRESEKLQTVLESILDTPGSHTSVTADLTTQTGRRKVVEVSRHASALVNLAGVNKLQLLADMVDSDLEKLLNTNLTTPILMSKDMMPYLLDKPEAWLINVGSIMGSIGLAGSAAYCASKFGLRGFTESLRRELADTNVHVSYVAPRATSTRMNDDRMTDLNQKLGNTVDNAQVVAKFILQSLSTSKSTTQFIGWPERFFVKLNAILPGLVDNAMFKKLPLIKLYAQNR